MIILFDCTAWACTNAAQGEQNQTLFSSRTGKIESASLHINEFQKVWKVCWELRYILTLFSTFWIFCTMMLQSEIECRLVGWESHLDDELSNYMISTLIFPARSSVIISSLEFLSFLLFPLHILKRNICQVPNRQFSLRGLRPVRVLKNDEYVELLISGS